MNGRSWPIINTYSPQGLMRAARQKDSPMAVGSGSPKIEARDVDFYYGRKQVLFGISLDILPRAITALIGPSGCGKSTFIRALNRMNDLIPGTRLEGSVRIEGEDIYQNGYDVVTLRRKVGMVFQKPNPFPKSIFDNVAYGPRIHGIWNKDQLQEIVEASLKAAALWEVVRERLNSSALGLSGGEQQRLCIARALAVEPEILLMDEPASSLDPIATAKIEELVKELRKRYTIVIVTHNMQQAARVSDTTAFFHLGRLVEFDQTDKLFTRPGKKETEDYITGKFG